MRYLDLTAGYRTALADGTLVPDSPKHMATEELYRAYPGDKIHLCDDRYVFAPAVFSMEREQEYIVMHIRRRRTGRIIPGILPQTVTGRRTIYLNRTAGSVSVSGGRTGNILEQKTWDVQGLW